MMALPVASTNPSVKTSPNIAPTRVIAKLDGKEFQAYKSTVFKSLDTIITQFTSLLHMKQAKDRLNQERVLEERAQRDEASQTAKTSMLKKTATSGLAFIAGALAVYLSNKIEKAINAIYDWAKSTFVAIGSKIIDALHVIPFIGPSMVAGAYLLDVMKGIANQFKKSNVDDDGKIIEIDFNVASDEAILDGVLGDATEDLQELSTRLDNVLDDLIDTSFGGIFKKPDPDDKMVELPEIPEAPAPTHAPEGSYTPPPEEYSIFKAERDQTQRMAPSAPAPTPSPQVPGQVEPNRPPDRSPTLSPPPASAPTHAPDGSQVPPPQSPPPPQPPPPPSSPPPAPPEGKPRSDTIPGKSDGKFTSPAPGYPITSKFGPRIMDGQWQQHTGIDFGTPSGTPIKASADGTATFKASGITGGYGNMVVINHADGYMSWYAHLQKPMIGNNQSVRAGDVIGISDNTGRSTGPHLHFEIRKNNVPVDPLSLIGAAGAGGNPSPDTERRAAALETGNPNATAAADRNKGKGTIQPIPGAPPTVAPKIEYAKVGPGSKTFIQRPQSSPIATPALSARA